MRIVFAAIMLSLIALTASASEKKDEPALGQSLHIALDPVTVSIFRENRVRGILSIDVSLELSQLDNREEVEKIIPRLRDQFVMALTKLAANRVDVTRPIDVDGVTAVLQSATDRTLGGKVARVLVVGAVVRRL